MVAYTAIQKFPGCGRNDSWQNLARAAVILFLFFCFLFFCALITLHAQVDSGKIVGTVKDASGAIVSAATVTVTETQTNAEKKIDTNSAGEYVVTELKPGIYTVKAERARLQDRGRGPVQVGYQSSGASGFFFGRGIGAGTSGGHGR